MATLVASRMTGSIPGLLTRLADFIGPSDLTKRLQRVRKKLGSRGVVEARGRHDFTVRLADKEVEVECKSVTGDCGNAIHREEFDMLGDEILKRLRRLELGSQAVRIDVAIADRLPKAPVEVKSLVDSIVHAISGGELPNTTFATISISQIGVSPIDPKDPGESGRRALDEIREERNGSVFGFYDRKQFIAVHVYSERDSRVQDSIRSTIEAASPQFTKSRPGVIWAHFSDLNDRELNSLIEIDRNGSVTLLRGIAYKMFNSEKHRHVAALFFSGEAPVRKFGGPESLIIHNPFYSQRGTIYPLWNRACSLNQPFRELM